MSINAGEIVAHLKADSSQFSAGINVAAKKLDEFGNTVQGSSNKIGSLLNSGLIVGAGALLTAKLTEPMLAFGAAAIKSADQLEQATIAYETLLGSGEAAAKMLSDMKAFAATTPFEFPELITAGKRLLAMGFTAQELIPTMRNVGNAVSGLGGDAGVMNRIILAMGQIRAKGQLMSQEMRQLAESGIPAWEILAKHLNVSIPEAMDMVTKKQVDGAQALTALQAGMAAKFGGLMEKQAMTVQGTMSNLRDTIGFIMTDIGTELIKTLRLKEVIVSVREYAESFLTWFRSLDDGTKRVILVLTGAFAASGPILVAVGAFMAAMTLITAPMLAAGAIVTGIIAGAVLIITSWSDIKNKAIAIWTGLRDAVIGQVKAIADGIKTHLTDRLNAIVAPVQKFADSVLGIFKRLRHELVGGSEVPDMVEEIGDHMRMLDTNMVGPARSAAKGTWDVFRQLAGQMDSVSRQISNVMVGTWNSAVSTMSNAMATQIIKGNDWKQTMESIGVSTLSSFINLGIQLAAQKALQLAIDSSMNGAIVAGNAAAAGATVSIWTSAGAAITGAFGAMSAAIATFFTATIIPMFAAVGQAVMTFLAALATSLDISIFGAPFSIPVWAAVGLVAAAVGVISAFAFGAFAEGGIVKGPMMGLVGEAGPEAIIPLDQLSSIIGNSGQTTVIVELDGRILARSVFDNMPSIMRVRGMSA